MRRTTLAPCSKRQFHISTSSAHPKNSFFWRISGTIWLSPLPNSRCPTGRSAFWGAATKNPSRILLTAHRGRGCGGGFGAPSNEQCAHHPPPSRARHGRGGAVVGDPPTRNCT